MTMSALVANRDLEPGEVIAQYIGPTMTTDAGTDTWQPYRLSPPSCLGFL